MNGIPTTFNDGLPSYTVIGGGKRCGPPGISAVLLGRGEEDRETRYQGLARAGFEQVLSIEERDPDTDISYWAAAFPFVRFIFLNEPLPAGSQINLAAAELKGKFFLVMKKDCGLEPEAGTVVKAETLAKEAGNLCSVPLMFDKRKAALPAQPLVEFSNGILRTRMAVPAAGSWNLFPFEGIGIYNRELFVRLGGFDNSIRDEYWQFMDFGLRAYTWGERIRSTGAAKVIRGTAPAQYAVFIGEGYRRFYLKNLSPVYRLDAAHLPLRRFPFFLIKSGIPVTDAWDEFSMARAWVNQNAYRWKCDARTLLKNKSKNGEKAPS
ncbi:MAG: hypothetical protein LBL31_04455 [Spirochaetaceae bacterium]|jgi:hypothetical protein|nr:hypothetical protein [Spirochaetaceae bacterium]